MTPNPVLSQLPKAQESYETTLSHWDDVDTTELLLMANRCIREARDKGLLCCTIGGIVGVCVAEKAAIELQELGYKTLTQQGDVRQAPDGAGIVQTYSLHVNWKYLPDSTRENYN